MPSKTRLHWSQLTVHRTDTVEGWILTLIVKELVLRIQQEFVMQHVVDQSKTSSFDNVARLLGEREETTWVESVEK